MAEVNIRNNSIFAESGLPQASDGVGVYPAQPDIIPLTTPQMGMAMQAGVWDSALAMPDCHRTLITQTAVPGLWGAHDAALMSTPFGLALMRVTSNGFSAYCDVDMDSSGSMATMAFQLAGPFVPETRVASAELAATWIKRVGMALLANVKTCCTNMYPNISAVWAAARAAGQEGEQPGALGGIDFNSDNEAAVFPLSFTGGNQPTLAAAVAFIRFLADMTKDQTSSIMSVMVGTVIAITKRGNITRPKLRNVIAELSKATSKELLCDLQDIRHIFDVIGRTINKENARSYFDSVREMCGMDNGMRLSLMATQASLAGLTQIVVIRTALHNHPNFPWVRLQEMWPAQMTAVLTALTAISNNPFYGFDSDLGQVKATLYKDVFVVAKKLVIKLDGVSTLSNYAGGKSMCANSDEIEGMIERYIQYRSTPPQGAYPPDVLQKTANLLASAASSDRLAMDVQA